MADVLEQVRQLTDTWLARRVGFAGLTRATLYASSGRVGSIEVIDARVHATVQGSDEWPYTVVLTPDAAGSVTMRCSCPVGGDCKHCAAVVLAIRRNVPDETPAPEPAVPAWRQALEAFATPASGAPLALQFELDGGRVLLQLRAPGRSRPWVKTDIDWQRLRHPVRDFDAGQRRALLGLAATVDARHRSGGPGAWGQGSWGQNSSGQGSWGQGSWGQNPWGSQPSAGWDHSTSLLLDRLGPDCWRWLREAVEAGVTLLAPRELDAVRLCAPASLVVDASTEPDASVMLRAWVQAGDEQVYPDTGSETAAETGEAARLVGDPPHGLTRVRDGELLLVPLDGPLDAEAAALLTEHREVRIPASDVPEFVATHLAGLRRRLPLRDEHLDLPRAERPRLVADIGVQQFSGTITWSLRYEVAGRGIELPAPVSASDPPWRDPDAERDLARAVGEGPWTPAPIGTRAHAPLVDVQLEGRAWMRFVEEVLPLWQQHPDVVVRLTGEPAPFREAVDAPEVRLGVQPPDAAHWFGLDVEVSIDGEQVPFAELFTALSLGHDELVLESGLWFDLQRADLQRLRDLIAEASRLTERPPGEVQLRPEHAGIWAELVELGVVDQQASAWQQAVDALLHVEHLPPLDPPPSLQATLRPYQLTGFRWLTLLWQTGLGGILADEMGLGKTLQSLAFLAWARDAGELDAPALVVAPTSVIDTWQREAAIFAPGLTVVARTATTGKSGVPLAEQIADADVVVTSYTLLRLDQDEFCALPWSAVLLDEAQFVKNRQSQAHRAVRRLPARLKVALTGTPLENNLMDLWSMLSIVAPGMFRDPHVFTELYRRPIESGDGAALARLQRRIRPLVLRRTKDAVAPELPAKQEAVIEVELDAAHRRAYDRQLQRERQKVLKLVDDLDHHRVSVLRSLTLLRRLALSPRLVDAEAPATSAKIDVLVERLRELAADGHRALVFSQFTGHLDLVGERLAAEGIAASRLDGATRDRARVVEQFRTGDDPVFLISLRAGGFGLTLVEADYVFLLDPWWNPAAENQAIDRTHRIGQTRHVMVYRLVATGTIEQKVLELQRAKRDLFDQVVGDADLAAPLDADDIRALLAD